MPRKAGTGTKSDRQRIQFAYNADREMAIGVVFRYLIDNPLMSSREGKHKGLDAMSAFWKPFAYQACTDATEEDLHALARESMEALAHQMALISDTFGVEPPKTENTPQQEQLQEMIQQAVTAAMLNLVESGAITMPQSHPSGGSATPASLEGVGVDDAMFAGLTASPAK
ncbi:hypothetical protein [Leptolyngbya sp. KIOST-1]|uniref:hypothetical protein n=1 Tax=Leptolyngbya sp. KIOST-1 TaxID=1229172 RepID=UPI000563A378|nr:hypothetical protein [Leptolyngbya sp. KIOST-1]